MIPPEHRPPSIYDAFDSFLNVKTWHTKHAEDERRFFEALHLVVDDADFNPDQMGESFIQKLGLEEGHGVEGSDSVDHYVAAAWAVRTYRRVNNLGDDD